MKKLLLGVLALAMFACNSGADKAAEEKCNAKNLQSAVNCLCDLYNQLDNSDDLSDEEYYKLNDKTEAFNKEIDKAIDEEIYSNDELLAAASKINCNL